MAFHREVCYGEHLSITPRVRAFVPLCGQVWLIPNLDGVDPGGVALGKRLYEVMPVPQTVGRASDAGDKAQVSWGGRHRKHDLQAVLAGEVDGPVDALPVGESGCVRQVTPAHLLLDPFKADLLGEPDERLGRAVAAVDLGAELRALGWDGEVGREWDAVCVEEVAVLGEAEHLGVWGWRWDEATDRRGQREERFVELI